MFETNQEGQLPQDIGLEVLRGDWTTYADQTRQFLDQILKCYGEEAAYLATQAIWGEFALRESAAKQRMARLQEQLDDARTVLHLQERELARLKATNGRKRIRELEQRCTALEEALAEKPLEEAAAKAALIDSVLRAGEEIGFPAVFYDEGVLIEAGLEAYCDFCHADAVSIEKLELARVAIDLKGLTRAGRKRLETLGEARRADAKQPTDTACSASS